MEIYDVYFTADRVGNEQAFRLLVVGNDLSRVIARSMVLIRSNMVQEISFCRYRCMLIIIQDKGREEIGTCSR
ncbi:hypothetical protein D3C86_2169950 [compost metagenome]